MWNASGGHGNHCHFGGCGLDQREDLPKVKVDGDHVTGRDSSDHYLAGDGFQSFISFSPDEESIAYISDHNGSFEIYARSLAPGAREAQLTTDGQQNFDPAWSLHGKRIAYYSMKRHGIFTMPALGGLATQLTDFGSHPVWSPDGQTDCLQRVDLGRQSRFGGDLPNHE